MSDGEISVDDYRLDEILLEELRLILTLKLIENMTIRTINLLMLENGMRSYAS